MQIGEDMFSNEINLFVNHVIKKVANFMLIIFCLLAYILIYASNLETEEHYA